MTELVDRFPGLVALQMIWEHKGVNSCTRCALSDRRKHVVFGEGWTEEPDVAFVRAHPLDPDATHPSSDLHMPFLERMIGKMGQTQPISAFVCYAVSCAPARGYRITPVHQKACEPVVLGQLRAVRPKVVVGLGLAATRTLTGLEEPGIGKWWWLANGRARNDLKIPVIGTHAIEDMIIPVSAKARPDQALRVKKQEIAWEHLQLVLSKLEKP